MTDGLIGVAIESSLRAAVLAASIALLLRLLRVRTSRTTHTAWTAVLAAMVLMPVLTQLVPPVRIAVPADVDPVAALRRAPVYRPQLPASGNSDAALAVGPITASGPAPRSEAAASQAVADNAARIPWRTLIVASYAAGAGFFLLRIFWGLLQLVRIRRDSRSVPALGPDVLESPLVATPVTIGPVVPQIVLPLRWTEWPADMLAAVLAHERAHAARRDPLISLVARLNCALFWFHPVAWWLERTLATTAEHACDDAAVAHVATRRRYAEVLLEVAVAVRRHQGRLIWHGVGVDGNGPLDRRIDRVLIEGASPAPSRTRTALVAVSCAIAIAAAVACSRDASVVPLREDPELAARLKADQERGDSFRAAQSLSLQEAAALEALLEKNPEDTATRQKLLAFYHWTGRNTQSWNDNVAARRRHALWLIQHHPDSALIEWARLSKAADPDGYAQARALWLAQVAKPDADVKVLSNAAWFFAESEKPEAERLLLRAQSQQPDGPQPRVANGVAYASWSSRLGQLYASAIVADPDSSYAREVRDKLEQSTDAALLAATSQSLFSQARWSGPAGDVLALSRRYLERAGQFDSAARQFARERLQAMDAHISMEAGLSGSPGASWRQLLERATGAEKVWRLAAGAEVEFLNAEYLDWRTRQPEGSAARSPNVQVDKENAAAMFARSKAYAQQAIDLASAATGGEQYRDGVFRAHIALGLNLLREGNRDGAVRELLAASKVPAPKEPPAEPRSLLEYRLVNYLLKHGERETVVEYLERAAPARRAQQREEMLKAAAAIRDGRMPEQYQRLLASGHL